MNHTENNGHGGGGGGGRAGGGGGGPPRYPGAARVPETGFVEVKSKFDAEFRRFSIDRSSLKLFGIQAVWHNVFPFFQIQIPNVRRFPPSAIRDPFNPELLEFPHQLHRPQRQRSVAHQQYGQLPAVVERTSTEVNGF